MMTPRPFKVALVITHLGTGGAEAMLLKILQQLDRSYFTPTVISLMGLGEIGPRIRALGIPVYTINMSYSLISIFKLVRLFIIFRRLKPDLVHTWMYHADLLGGVVARLSGCSRVVWCIRQSNLSPSENKRSTLIVVKACSLFSRWVPSQIISCSQRAAEVHASVGYQSDKLHVIPNGFDLMRFVPDKSSRIKVRAELGLGTDTPLVGLIARFDSQKNHIGFIEAADQVHRQMPSVHFLLVGTGVTNANAVLNDEIKGKGLQYHMHLLGRRDDIPQLMASLDVLASSSHGEAFPNVLGEAMACGVPCVVTDVGDSSEIVGNTGRVVAAGDMKGLAESLLEILSRPPEYRSDLGVKARSRVEANYEICKVTRLYENFYVRVMEDICAD